MKLKVFSIFVLISKQKIKNALGNKREFSPCLLLIETFSYMSKKCKVLDLEEKKELKQGTKRYH